MYLVDQTVWHFYNVVQTKYFADVNTNRTYKQSDLMNCTTTFVIFHLSCPHVERFFYIGCTKRHLRDRLAKHKYSIRIRNRDYTMASEFHNANDSLLHIEGFEHIKLLVRGARIQKLNQREGFF